MMLENFTNIQNKVDINSCFLIAQVGIGICTASSIIEAFREKFESRIKRLQNDVDVAEIQYFTNLSDHYQIELQKATQKNELDITQFCQKKIAQINQKPFEKAKKIDNTTVSKWASLWHYRAVTLSGASLFLFLIISPFCISLMAECSNKENTPCTLVSGWWLGAVVVFTCSPLAVPLIIWITSNLYLLRLIVVRNISKYWLIFIYKIIANFKRWANKL